MNSWTKEYPTVSGDYWFYGYRYGKISVGRETEPEMMFVTVRGIANGVLVIANGQHMWEDELEEAYFMKADIPEVPY